MSNAVEVRVPTEVAAHIRGIQPYLERLLDDPSRFAITLMSAGRRQPEIFDCTPASIVGAALVCAQLDLEPGPADHVYLIPRRNKKINGRPLELTTLLGYKGMKALAERHPDIRHVETGIVCEGDEFEHVAQPASLTHRPRHGDRGDPYLWYAIAHRSDGGRPHIAVIDHAEVERRRSFSASPDRGPWVENRQRMCLKSAVRALWPELPSSLDLSRAAYIDDAPGAITAQDLGAPALARPDAGQDRQEERETITVHGQLVDEETGEVLADGDLEDDPPERQEDTDAAGPGKPAHDDEEAGASSDPGEGPGAPASSGQVRTIGHLQGAHSLDDHDLCQIIRDRFDVDADTVEDAIGGLTEAQAGDLILKMQGAADEPPPEQA